VNRFSAWSNTVQYIIYALALTTTACSVFYAYFTAIANGEEEEEEEDSLATQAANFLHKAVIILPLFSALFTAVRSRLRSRDKHAKCAMAAYEVVAEIYKYRARTLEYDTSVGSTEEDKAKEEKEEGVMPTGPGVKSGEQLTRELFVKRVQNIYASAITGEVQSGGALRHDGILAANIEAPLERAAFVDKLKAHIVANFYGQRAADREEILDSAKQTKQVQTAKRRGGLSSSKGTEPDDLTTAISIETYVHSRVRPYAAHLEKQAPLLSRRLQLLDLLVFMCNSAGAILAVVVVDTTSLATFVAISVAFAATFSSMIEYHNLQAQVTATNGALRDIHNLLVWWAGLSMVDRRTRFTKYHVVGTLERCLISTVAAEAAAVMQGESADGADGQQSGLGGLAGLSGGS